MNEGGDLLAFLAVSAVVVFTPEQGRFGEKRTPDVDRTRSIPILLICGSLRAGSTNEAVLRTARASSPEGVEATFYDGMGDLPLFNPDDDPPEGPAPPAVAMLRQH